MIIIRDILRDIQYSRHTLSYLHCRVVVQFLFSSDTDSLTHHSSVKLLNLLQCPSEYFLMKSLPRTLLSQFNKGLSSFVWSSSIANYVSQLLPSSRWWPLNLACLQQTLCQFSQNSLHLLWLLLVVFQLLKPIRTLDINSHSPMLYSVLNLFLYWDLFPLLQ